MSGSTSRAIARLLAVTCALSLATASTAGAQAGVLVLGFSSQVHCSPGSEHTTIGGSCGALTCPPGRVCVDLEGVGARCIDPSNELVCVPGEDGCRSCPLVLTTGMDAEACRVVELAEGPHAICVYHERLVCLTDPSFAFDAIGCLSFDVNEPSLALGDCDGDGIDNGSDRCLCVAGSDATCAPPTDAGVADAGRLDGAVVDASAAPDAGALDASVFDAGRALDAESGFDGSSPPVAPEFRGGGGCACRVTAARPRGLAGLSLAGFAGLVCLRSRARATRRRGRMRGW